MDFCFKMQHRVIRLYRNLKKFNEFKIPYQIIARSWYWLQLFSIFILFIIETHPAVCVPTVYNEYKFHCACNSILVSICLILYDMTH